MNSKTLQICILVPMCLAAARGCGQYRLGETETPGNPLYLAGTAPTRPATSPAETLAQVTEHLLTDIEFGETRIFGGRGPEVRLPESYDYAAAHPEIALGILKAKQKSENSQIRFNAYDFLTALLDVPAVRDEALSILEKARRSEGLAQQGYIGRALAKFRERSTTTHSAKD
jgi:hypothetical protein